MKLLLLQPPIEDFYETDIRLQPIGLCYLKAAVKKFLPEIEVVIKDYHRGWGRKTIAIPKELSYLKEYYPYPDASPFSTFHHFFHFGADYETIAEDVARENPDWVGISILFSPYYREALAAADVIKKRLNIPILAGGSHVSAMPEQILSHASIDHVIIGEGEKPLVEFLKAWPDADAIKSIPGVGSKYRGNISINTAGDNYKMDEIPWPDLSDFPVSHYSFEHKPMTFMITSRSCPHRCTFCSVHKTFGFQFRRRDIEDIFQEIKYRYDSGYRVIDFEDDNLTFFKDEMKALCRFIIAAFPRKDIEFTAMNGISYLSLDAELLSLMKDAGFTHLNLALVSSDTTVRETTKRPHTTEKFLEVVQQAHSLKLKIVSYQILGLPSESLESMIQTLIFQTRLPVLLGASLFYLTPNSPIASTFPKPDSTAIFLSRLTAMAIESTFVRRNDLYTLFITTRILNYLKSGRVSQPHNFLSLLRFFAGRDKRSRIGVHQLIHLIFYDELCAHTSTGLKLLPHFDINIFWTVWNQIGTLRNLDGDELILPSQDELKNLLIQAPQFTKDFLKRIPHQESGKRSLLEEPFEESLSDR